MGYIQIRPKNRILSVPPAQGFANQVNGRSEGGSFENSGQKRPFLQVNCVLIHSADPSPRFSMALYWCRRRRVSYVCSCPSWYRYSTTTQYACRRPPSCSRSAKDFSPCEAHSIRPRDYSTKVGVHCDIEVPMLGGADGVRYYAECILVLVLSILCTLWLPSRNGEFTFSSPCWYLLRIVYSVTPSLILVNAPGAQGFA
jgi:hypothetical protein